jgi:transcriptional regulator with XRE-family HTH domain
MGTHKEDDIAQLILSCRTERGLTLEDVAQAIGISAKAVSNIELGKSAPRRTTRAKLDEFLRKHGYFAKKVA